MATERQYNVPLRHAWLRVQKFRRAKKAVTELRAFLVRHMKSENVKLGPYVNEEIWARGIRNPPHHVKINVVKSDDGAVVAELVGKPMPGAEKKEATKSKKEMTKESKAVVKEEAQKAKAPKTAEKAQKQAPKAMPQAHESKVKPQAPTTAKK